ncbi:MAG: zf-TFIIB domain-containing protein [Bacteriovoracaceae bacterium]|jgi:Zn-finger nucleic acid-binding protein|nr:zf-TFIIB domain-containing protein [Bacteriovoracaceae bacterium]
MSDEGLCLRCNYAYATTIDDNMPVCEACKSNFGSEEARTCPVDQTLMKKLIVKNVMIDKCPKCSGIWLDGDEVSLLGNLASGSFKSSWAQNECKESKSSGSFWKGFILGAIVTDD